MIVGGMSPGTLLTLCVVPTVCTLLARRKGPGAKLAVVDTDPAPAG